MKTIQASRERLEVAIGVLIAAVDQEVRGLSQVAGAARIMPDDLAHTVGYAADCGVLRERLTRLQAGWRHSDRSVPGAWAEASIEGSVVKPKPGTPDLVPMISTDIPKVGFTRVEAAKALSVSVPTLDRLVARGLLRPSLATRRSLFSSAELERFMAETSKRIEP